LRYSVTCRAEAPFVAGHRSSPVRRPDERGPTDDHTAADTDADIGHHDIGHHDTGYHGVRPGGS
jgi:hypothetical protein